MLSELSAHTVDSRGYRTFATGKNLKKILKSANLKGFSLYFDPEAELLSPSTEWTQMRLEEWDAHFLIPIKHSLDSEHLNTSQFPFLLKPVSGHLKFDLWPL